MHSMIDAVDRVTGRAAYVANVELPGMLYAKLLRSIASHARITRLDVSKARAFPGVHAVITGGDVAARSDVHSTFGPVLRDQPILAIDRVRYIGEPVAAVAADSAAIAQEALSLIDVEYDELPAVFDEETALAEGATLVHPQPPRQGDTFADLVFSTESKSNVCAHFRLRRGDVEQAFARAEYVFEDIFRSPAVQHVSLEPHVCVADVHDGRITVWATSQTPHQLRAQLADVLKAPLANVRVLVSTLGGGYGGKAHATIEPAIVLLAMATRHPVKCALTREEEFVTISKHAATIRSKVGLDRDGKILARKMTLHFNTGAYAQIGPRVIQNGGHPSAGPYFTANCWVDSYAVYTNTPPAGAFRGFGVSQGAWAYESQMDAIAERIGIDPYELRMRNLLVDGQAYITGQTMDDCHFRETLTDAARGIGWNPAEKPVRNGNRVRAKGVACIIKGMLTPSVASATLKLNDDGSLNVLTSCVEMGQGVQTALSLIAAQETGIPVERVQVAHVDTDVTPYDQGTVASRSTYSTGHAIKLAAQNLREQLGVDDEQIGSVDLGALVRKARLGTVIAHGSYSTKGGLDPADGQGIASIHFHQGAGGAEVEVDLETGKIEILRYHASVWAGRIINPTMAKLQTEGNVAFGVGQALFEEMVFDQGQLKNVNLGDYMIPSIHDMPPTVASMLESPDAKDVHGLGETALPAVMPAIGNAVARAIGARVVDLPLVPERVLRAIRAREKVAASV